MKKRTIGLGILCLFIGLAGCGKDVTSGSAATVVGSSISREEYYSYLEQKGSMLVTVDGRVANAGLAGSPGFQAIKDLVVNRIIEKLAKDQGVLPTDTDVENELKFQQVDNPRLVEEALSKGITVPMLKDEVLVSLAKFNLITKGVTVTPDQTSQYVKDHPDQFMNPATIDANMIVVDTDAKKALVDKDLSAGKPFIDVAKEYSTDPNGNQTGFKFPQNNLSALPPALQTLFNNTTVAHNTDWVKVKEGWVKFYLSGKSPASPKTVTDHLKEEVRRGLMEQKGIQATDFDKMVRDELIKDKDNIIVTQPAAKDAWNQFVLTMVQTQNAPLQAGSTVSPTPPAPGASAPGATAPTPSPAPTGTAKH